MLPIFVPLLLVLLATTPATPAGECFVQTGPYVMIEPLIEFVFSGRVVEKTTGDATYRATLEVDRVWKGPVPKRLDLHVWQAQSPEMPSYEKGGHYVVLAKRLSDPRVRMAVGLGNSDDPAFTATHCAAVLSPTIREELGAGSVPNGTPLAGQANPPQTTATAGWVAVVPREQDILAAAGDATGAAAVVDQTLGRELRARFNKSDGPPTIVNVLASQLPEGWLPQIPNVQFRRMDDVTAAKEFSEACLRIASIRSIKVSDDILTVDVIEGDRCSTFGGTYSLQKKGGHWELAVSGGIHGGSVGVTSHCGCTLIPPS